VEFEYQIRQKLKDFLQAGEGTAPPPAPVEQQDLNPGAPPPPSGGPAPPAQ
jgi:hypothetical protein